MQKLQDPVSGCVGCSLVLLEGSPLPEKLGSLRHEPIVLCSAHLLILEEALVRQVL